MVCPPVRGDNSRALASGLSSAQADKPWYKYFIPPSTLQALLSVKYMVLQFAISGKSDIIIYLTVLAMARDLASKMFS